MKKFVDFSTLRLAQAFEDSRWIEYRCLIASEIAAWPLPLLAQQKAIPVIGFLTTASEATRGGDQLTAFHHIASAEPQ